MSLAIVEKVRSKYPTPLGDQHDEFLTEVIQALGPEYGLLRKAGGTRVTVAGVDVSQDVVTTRAGLQIDILGDGEGAATPAWSPVDPSHYTPDPSRFYRPAGLVDLPEDTGDYAERLDQLETAFTEFVVATIRTLEAFDTRVKALVDEVGDLVEELASLRSEVETEPAPRTITIEGQTEERGVRPFRHSHNFKTEVTV